jgi:hypothetical protein
VRVIYQNRTRGHTRRSDTIPVMLIFTKHDRAPGSCTGVGKNKGPPRCTRKAVVSGGACRAARDKKRTAQACSLRAMN